MLKSRSPVRRRRPDARSSMAHELLFAQDISFSSTGISRLDRLRLLLQQGELTALIGINGSGKTLLSEILSGQRPPDSGKLFLEGKPAVASQLQAAVSLIRPDDHLIDSLSVPANLFMSQAVLRQGLVYRPRQVRQVVYDLLRTYHLETWTDVPVRQIPRSIQHLLLIVRAVVKGSRLIILNSITADYSESELDLLGACLKMLIDSQTSVLLLSNHWNRLFNQAQRVVVIRNGRNIKTFWDTHPGQPEVAVHLTDTTRKVQTTPEIDASISERPDLLPSRANDYSILTLLGRTIHPGVLTGFFDSDESKEPLLKRLADELRLLGQPDLVRIDSQSIQAEFIPSLSLLENSLILLEPGLKHWHGLISRDYKLVIRDELERKLAIPKRYFNLPISLLPRPDRFKLLLFALRFRNPPLIVIDNLTTYSDDAEKKLLLAELRRLATENYRIVYLSTDRQELEKSCSVIWRVSAGTLSMEDPQS